MEKYCGDLTPYQCQIGVERLQCLGVFVLSFSIVMFLVSILLDVYAEYGSKGQDGFIVYVSLLSSFIITAFYAWV